MTKEPLSAKVVKVLKDEYQCGLNDGYFDAMRHLFIQWRGNSCMETRQADRWTIGILNRYIAEKQGQLTKEYFILDMELFFGLEVQSTTVTVTINE